MIWHLTLLSQKDTSDTVTGNIRLELKFGKDLPNPISVLLYMEYDNSVLIDALRNVLYRLYVLLKSFLGVYPSDVTTLYTTTSWHCYN